MEDEEKLIRVRTDSILMARFIAFAVVLALLLNQRGTANKTTYFYTYKNLTEAEALTNFHETPCTMNTYGILFLPFGNNFLLLSLCC